MSHSGMADNTCRRSLHCQIVGCHNSHNLTYTSQLIMQKELLFNISCKIAYFSIVQYVLLC